MIDADERRGRVSLADHRRQVAESAEVPDVHRDDEIGALDLARRPVARISAIGNQEVEPLGDLRGIGDADRNIAGAQQIPQPDLAPDPVAIGVDMSRQNDVAGTGERRRDVARRLRTGRGNRNAVRVHCGEDNRLVPGADLAPLVVFSVGAGAAPRVYRRGGWPLGPPPPLPPMLGGGPPAPPASSRWRRLCLRLYPK